MPSTRSQRPGERCPCPRERIPDSSGRDGPFCAGDICLVQASIFEPYLQMLHRCLQALGEAQSCKSTQSTQTDPEDSTKIKKKIQKYLKEVKGESAGHLKTRPAVIGFLSNTGTATVFLMGTLEKGVNDTDPLPEAFAKFAIPVYTKSLVDTSSDHLHTVPEWHEQKPQWIFTIPIKTTTPSSDERWRCDPPILCTTTGYYLQAETLARLEQVHGEQDMTFKFEEQSKPNSTWDYAREIIRLYENRPNPKSAPSIATKASSRKDLTPLKGICENLNSKLGSRNGSRTSFQSGKLPKITEASKTKMARSQKENAGIQPTGGASGGASTSEPTDPSWTLVGPGGRHGHRH